jgi:hypothetical protein
LPAIFNAFANSIASSTVGKSADFLLLVSRLTIQELPLKLSIICIFLGLGGNINVRRTSFSFFAFAIL